jgi:hypothetical protein
VNHGWWWHLFHDPMRDNPWSMVALVVAVGLLGLLVGGLNRLDRTLRDVWHRRKNRGKGSEIPEPGPWTGSGWGDGL